MGFVFTNVYIFIMALVLAILEVQIEGAHGWAKELPTWRPQQLPWYLRLYAKFMGGRDVTGYHLSIFAFVLLIFHLPYVFGLVFSWPHELYTLAWYLLFVVLWDFLWFVVNPHYPLSSFGPQTVWWHPRWLGGVPVDYWVSPLLSLLILLPLVVAQGWEPVWWWLANVLLFLLQTLLVVVITLYFFKIDSWKKPRLD